MDRYIRIADVSPEDGVTAKKIAKVLEDAGFVLCHECSFDFIVMEKVPAEVGTKALDKIKNNN